MTKIYKLVFQVLQVIDDEIVDLTLDEQIKTNSKLEYGNEEQGWFTSLDKVQNAIPERIEMFVDDPNLILGIYAIVEQIDDESPYTNVTMNDSDIFTFFNKDGSMLPRYDYKKSTPKYDIGEIVIFHDTGSLDDDSVLEIGIIQQQPSDNDNVYIILVGATLHHHYHPTEGFLTEYDSDCQWIVNDLEARLKIGY